MLLEKLFERPKTLGAVLEILIFVLAVVIAAYAIKRCIENRYEVAHAISEARHG